MNVLPEFRKGVRFELGDGEHILFWEDPWLGDRALRDDFGSLFTMSSSKGRTVSECMVNSNGSVAWNLGINRSLNDWTIDGLASLLSRLDTILHIQHAVDKLIWWPGKHGKFSTKSFYYSIMGWSPPRRATPIPHFPGVSIWGSRVPSKISFFAWCAAHERVLTIDNLRKRHFPGFTPNSCLFCAYVLESVNHLFLHCPFSWWIWCCVLGESGLCWVSPGRVIDLFTTWQPGPFSARGRRIWSIVPFAVIWGLWLERNRRHFEHSAWDTRRVFLLIKGLTCFWSKTFEECKGIPFDHFVFRWEELLYSD